MRKLIPLTLIALCSYCFLQAQKTATNTTPNFGKDFAKNYQENDLYEIDIVRSDKKGYALQVASFSSYENVVRYVTDLQGRWFSNVLLKLGKDGKQQPIYKILLGPFPNQAAVSAYKKKAKEEGLNGFVVSLAQMTVGAFPKATIATNTNKPGSSFSAKGGARPRPAALNPITTTNVEVGEASYYSTKFHGRITASGEPFDMYDYTAAHWTLPFDTKLEVCRLDSKKCVTVRINDRGPNPTKAFGKDGKPRIIDLSLAAAEAIGLVEAGVTQVRIAPASNTPPPPIDLETMEFQRKGVPVKQKPSNNGATSFTQTGEASYYANKFHGKTTASGEPFDMYGYTAAHWTLPFNTKLKVCRIDTGKCVNVRVNDRGPNPKKAFGKDGKPRVLDLSLVAAEAIGLVQAGVTQVRIEEID